MSLVQSFSNGSRIETVPDRSKKHMEIDEIVIWGSRDFGAE
jgi:hypothetical protein